MLRSHWREACEEREDGPVGAQKSSREAEAVISPAHKDLRAEKLLYVEIGRYRVSVLILYTQNESALHIYITYAKFFP